jgi:predicted Fe-Mo cluster-binding NifX family protein
MPRDALPARITRFPRTAVPVFMNRVSPVLDTCTRLCILNPGAGGRIRRKTTAVRGKTLLERAEEFRRHGVAVVVCGAVGSVLYNLLTERRVEIVCGITGDIEEVIEAYIGGTLSQERFRMPGAS